MSNIDEKTLPSVLDIKVEPDIHIKAEGEDSKDFDPNYYYTGHGEEFAEDDDDEDDYDPDESDGDYKPIRKSKKHRSSGGPRKRGRPKGSRGPYKKRRDRYSEDEGNGGSYSYPVKHCEICNKDYQSVFLYQNHLVMHHPELVDQDTVMEFPCDECDKVFKIKSYLQRHKKVTHGDVPPATCGKITVCMDFGFPFSLAFYPAQFHDFLMKIKFCSFSHVFQTEKKIFFRDPCANEE